MWPWWPGFPGVTKRKHAELPGEPAANTSVLLTAKVRDRDKGTENGEKHGEMALKSEGGGASHPRDRSGQHLADMSIPPGSAGALWSCAMEETQVTSRKSKAGSMLSSEKF